MIKAIIFDMDGVLFDTEKIMKKGWEKAADLLNFSQIGRASCRERVSSPV